MGIVEGTYYVFCSRCGTKALNIEATLDEDKKWVCCTRLEPEDLYQPSKPIGTVIRPKMVHAPSQVNNFTAQALTQWQDAWWRWETLTNTKWEDL